MWANSRRQWRTGKPAVLQSIGLQRVRHDLVTGRWQQIRRHVKCLSVFQSQSERRRSVLSDSLLSPSTNVALQAPPSMGFSRQEYRSGLPFPSPGDLPGPGIKPRSPTLQAGALTSEPPGKPFSHKVLSKEFVLLEPFPSDFSRQWKILIREFNPQTAFS